MHPRNRRRVQQDHDYPLGKYGTYKDQGWGLYNQSYEDIANKFEQHYGHRGNPQQMMQIMMNLMQQFQILTRLEAPYRERLEELAKEAAHRVWGIPKDQIEAKLVQMGSIDAGEDAPDEEDPELDEHDQAYVEQRVLMNQMTQGAAVHQYLTMHHIIRDELEQIDPRLIELYDKFSVGSVRIYWMIDRAGEAAGQAKLDENGDVVARAVCLPVLLQEISKGIMMKLTQRGMNKLYEQNPELAQNVAKAANKLKHEIWQIKMGPKLWQNFLKAVPHEVLPKVIMKLSMDSPRRAVQIINAIARDPEEAREILANYLSAPLEKYEKQKDETWYFGDEGFTVGEDKLPSEKYVEDCVEQIAEMLGTTSFAGPAAPPKPKPKPAPPEPDVDPDDPLTDPEPEEDPWDDPWRREQPNPAPKPLNRRPGPRTGPRTDIDQIADLL